MTARQQRRQQQHQRRSLSDEVPTLTNRHTLLAPRHASRTRNVLTGSERDHYNDSNLSTEKEGDREARALLRSAESRSLLISNNEMPRTDRNSRAPMACVPTAYSLLTMHRHYSQDRPRTKKSTRYRAKSPFELAAAGRAGTEIERGSSRR